MLIKILKIYKLWLVWDLWIAVYSRLVPESTRWLRMKGKLTEAMVIFNKMAKVNGRVLRNEEVIPNSQSQSTISKSTIADLFQPFSIAIYTLIQGAAWCVFYFKK